ncbi:MAG: hypothetical protein IJ112_01955 [Oscillospiraceae bacterium]|nr:hypothetical protein [Oscillospiraceae bacterium]
MAQTIGPMLCRISQHNVASLIETEQPVLYPVRIVHNGALLWQATLQFSTNPDRASVKDAALRLSRVQELQKTAQLATIIHEPNGGITLIFQDPPRQSSEKPPQQSTVMQNGSNAPRSGASGTGGKACELKHYDKNKFPYPQALKTQSASRFDGSSPERPIKLDLSVPLAKAGGTIRVSFNGQSVVLRYPAWVHNNELMYFISKDAIGFAKIELSTKTGKAAFLLLGLSLLMMLVSSLLESHIPAFETWLQTTIVDTIVEWILLILLAALFALHFVSLALYKADCRKKRPLP